jgi:hypothetical protein
MLMGAQLFWQILNKGQISLGHNKPVLQQTHFGWIIGGALNISPEQNHQSTLSLFFFSIVWFLQHCHYFFFYRLVFATSRNPWLATDLSFFNLLF